MIKLKVCQSIMKIVEEMQFVLVRCVVFCPVINFQCCGKCEIWDCLCFQWNYQPAVWKKSLC